MSAINDFFNSMQSGMNFATQASGLIGSIFRPSLKKQFKYQKKAMDYQAGISKDLYDYQFNNEAEYNDPTNYFKRLLSGADANNLSKAAVIDGGAAGQSGVQHGAVPGAGSGTSYDFAASDVGSKIMQNSLIGAQIRNLDSQSEKNRKESGPGGLIDSNVALNNRNAELAAQNSELIGEKLVSEVVRRRLERAQSVLLELQVDRYNELTDAEIDNLLMSAASHQSNANYTNKQNQYYDELALGQLSQTQSQVILNAALASAYRQLALKYGREAVAQLQQNEHWSRIVDDVEERIAAESYVSRLDASTHGYRQSVDTASTIVNSVGGFVSDIVSSLVGISHAASASRNASTFSRREARESRQRVTTTITERARYDKNTKEWVFDPASRTTVSK